MIPMKAFQQQNRAEFETEFESMAVNKMDE